jgi:hypothetical protein
VITSPHKFSRAKRFPSREEQGDRKSRVRRTLGKVRQSVEWRPKAEPKKLKAPLSDHELTGHYVAEELR